MGVGLRARADPADECRVRCSLGGVIPARGERCQPSAEFAHVFARMEHGFLRWHMSHSFLTQRTELRTELVDRRIVHHQPSGAELAGLLARAEH
jgi:hypothetical protein